MAGKHWFTPEIVAARALYEALRDDRAAQIAALATCLPSNTSRACRAIMDVNERMIEAETEYNYLRMIAKD